MRYIVILVLIGASQCAVAKDHTTELEQLFRSYSAAWSPEASINEIVAEYWHTKGTMFGAESIVQLEDRDAIVNLLSSVMQPVIEAGWQGTDLVGFSVCAMREGLALVGMEYQRNFRDGRSTRDGAIYVVIKRDGRWWITALMGSDSAEISC